MLMKCASEGVSSILEYVLCCVRAGARHVPRLAMAGLAKPGWLGLAGLSLIGMFL